MTYPRNRPSRLQTVLDLTAFLPRKGISHRSVQGCPPGDGSAIMVLPGILHGDGQTARFREGLRMLEYQAFGWEQRLNIGPAPLLMEGASRRLAQLARTHGPVRLIGFSMGGLYARWLAHARPNLVRQVITVCAPFRDPLRSAWIRTEHLVPFWRDVDVEALAHMVLHPPVVPWGAVYSRLDGITAWQACMDPAYPRHCEEVRVRHSQAPNEAAVLAACSRLLAQVK